MNSEQDEPDIELEVDSIDRFRVSLGEQAQAQYVESKLSPESDIQKSIGIPHHQFMASLQSTLEVAKEIIDEQKEEIDEESSSEIEEDVMGTPSFLTKTKLRNLSYEIDDLVKKMKEFDLNNVDGEEILSEIDIDEIYHRANSSLDTSFSKEEVNDEEIIDIINSNLERGYIDIYAQRVYRRKLSEIIIPFYLIYQTYIDEKTKDYIDQKLIDEEYQSTTGTYDFLSNLSQPKRESLIERTGEVPPHIVSQMVENRRMRNSIVHSLYGDDDFSTMEEAAMSIGRCISVLNELEDTKFDWPEL